MTFSTISKDNSQLSGVNSYNLSNITEDVIVRPVKPRLLTALLSDETSDQFVDQEIFTYDQIISSAVTLGSKRYDEYGNRINPDHSRKMGFRVGSHGGSWSIRVEEVKTINPRTKKQYTVEERVQEKVNKAMNGWGNYTEQAFTQLLMQDTNIGEAKHLNVYNYYTDIVGVARPAATAINFSAGTDVEIRDAINTEKKRLDEALDKYDLTSSRKVVLCGTDAFSAAWAEQSFVDFGRPVSGLDLATMGIPETQFGQNFFDVRYFDSDIHGVRFIEISGGIAGNAMAANAMRMVPMGVEGGLFSRVYAPAQRMSELGQPTKDVYMFSEANDFGAIGATESNVLYANFRPELVRWMTAT